MPQKILLTSGDSFTDPKFFSMDKSIDSKLRGGWPMWPELLGKELNLKVPYKTVRNIVPRAPIAPASVGVAQPNIIDPRTEKISVSNGTNAVIIIQTSRISEALLVSA